MSEVETINETEYFGSKTIYATTKSWNMTKVSNQGIEPSIEPCNVATLQDGTARI